MSILDTHAASKVVDPAATGLSAMPPAHTPRIHRPQVRDMDVSDIPEIRALLDRTIGVSLLPEETDAHLAAAIRANPGACTVAVAADGSIVGCCFAVHDHIRASFRHVAIDFAYRGQGLGAELLEPGYAHFRALGISRVIIQVGDENPAIEFWAKQGFVLDTGRGGRSVGMRKDLNLSPRSGPDLSGLEQDTQH